jgi:ribosomal protein L7/L12
MHQPLSEAQLAQLEKALTEGRKIEAIKWYRELTGVGLKEAKDEVEFLEASLPKNRAIGEVAVPSKDLGPNTTVNPSETDDVAALLFRGNKIGAIKRHREATGLGLKESKNAVEALERSLRRSSPEKFTPTPAGGLGCLNVLVVIAVVFCVTGYCMWGR